MGNASSSRIDGAKGLRVLAGGRGACPLPAFAVVLSEADEHPGPDGDTQTGAPSVSVLRLVQAAVARAAADPTGKPVDLFIHAPHQAQAHERGTALTPVGIVRRYLWPCYARPGMAALARDAAAQRRNAIADYVCPAVAPHTRVHGADRLDVVALVDGVAGLFAAAGLGYNARVALMALTGLCSADQFAAASASFTAAMEAAAQRATGAGGRAATPQVAGLRRLFRSCRRFADAYPKAAGVVRDTVTRDGRPVTTGAVLAIEILARWAGLAGDSRGMVVVCPESTAAELERILTALGATAVARQVCPDSVSACGIDLSADTVRWLGTAQAIDTAVFTGPDAWRSGTRLAAPGPRPPFVVGEPRTVRVCGFGRQAIVRANRRIVGAVLDVPPTGRAAPCPGGDPYLGTVSLADVLRYGADGRRFVSVVAAGVAPSALDALEAAAVASGARVRVFDTADALRRGGGLPAPGAMTVVVGVDVARHVGGKDGADPPADALDLRAPEVEEFVALTTGSEDPALRADAPWVEHQRAASPLRHLPLAFASWAVWVGVSSARARAASESTGSVRVRPEPALSLAVYDPPRHAPATAVPGWSARVDPAALTRAVLRGLDWRGSPLIGPVPSEAGAGGFRRAPGQFNSFVNPAFPGWIFRNATGRCDAGVERLWARLRAEVDAHPQAYTGVSIPDTIVVRQDNGTAVIVAESTTDCNRPVATWPDRACNIGSAHSAGGNLGQLADLLLRTGVVLGERSLFVLPGGSVGLRELAYVRHSDRASEVLRPLFAASGAAEERAVRAVAAGLGVPTEDIEDAWALADPPVAGAGDGGRWAPETTPPADLSSAQVALLGEWAADPQSRGGPTRLPALVAGDFDFEVLPTGLGPSAATRTWLVERLPEMVYHHALHVPQLQFVMFGDGHGRTSGFTLRRVAPNEVPLAEYTGPTTPALLEAARQLAMAARAARRRGVLIEPQLATDGMRLILLNYTRLPGGAQTSKRPDDDIAALGAALRGNEAMHDAFVSAAERGGGNAPFPLRETGPDRPPKGTVVYRGETGDLFLTGAGVWAPLFDEPSQVSSHDTLVLRQVRVRIGSQLAAADGLPLLRANAVLCKWAPGLEFATTVYAGAQGAEEVSRRAHAGYHEHAGTPELQAVLMQLARFVAVTGIDSAVTPEMLPLVRDPATGELKVELLLLGSPPGNPLVGLHNLLAMAHTEGDRRAVLAAARECGFVNEAGLRWLADGNARPVALPPAGTAERFAPLEPVMHHPPRTHRATGKKTALIVAFQTNLVNTPNIVVRIATALRARGYAVVVMADAKLEPVVAERGETVIGNAREKTVREQLQRLASETEAGDKLVVVFSMHGLYDAKEQESYLPLEPNANGVGDEYTGSEVASDVSAAGDVVVLWLACYSGAAVKTFSRRRSPDSYFIATSATEYGEGRHNSGKGEFLSDALLRTMDNEFRHTRFPELDKVFRVATEVHYDVERWGFDNPVAGGSKTMTL